MNSEDVKHTISRVLSGELDAFGAIIRAHQHEVWQIAAYALRDVAATEDLAQQVFVNVYLSLERFDPSRDIGVWVRSIARNQVRKELRTRQRDRSKRSHYRNWLETNLDAATGSDNQSERRDALRQCREALGPAAATAVELRYEGAQGMAAIAETLERSVAATRQLLWRTRVALRHCIEKRMARP